MECVRARAADHDEWLHQQGVNETYLHALGLIPQRS